MLKKLLLFQSLLTILIICVVFVVTSSGIVYFMSNYSKSGESTTSTEKIKYQISEYNPETKKTTLGIASLTDKNIPQGGFLTYTNELGSSILISHLGSSEFVCRGNCYCEKENYENNRKSSVISSVISKGFVYLLSAASLSVAYKLTTEYIEDESFCRDHFSEDCDPQHIIRSDISDCFFIPDDGSIIEDEDVTYDIGEVKYRRYMCHGKCTIPKGQIEKIKSDKVKDWKKKMFKENLEFCNSLEMEREVLLVEDKKFRGYTMSQNAEILFERDALWRFCRDEECHQEIVGCRDLGLVMHNPLNKPDPHPDDEVEKVGDINDMFVEDK